MLVSDRPYWPRIFRQIRFPLLFDVAFAFAVSIAHRHRGLEFVVLPTLPVSLVGAALGIILGFRTNSAYDRWWEARILWGALVNNSRTLCRQITTFTPEFDFARHIVLLQIAFVHTLRCHLRGEPLGPELESRLPTEIVVRLESQQNVPAALVQIMGQDIATHAGTGALSELRLQRLDQTLSDLTNIQGGCERIKNTPLPRQYDYFPELFIYLYLLMFPLSVVHELGMLTPLLSAVITFMFLILNRIGKNLEDPFDDVTYGTPLLALSRTIETNLLQQIGSKNLPAPVRPERGIIR
jgi:putative membrane protein